jgi:methyl-accepting chemotaxis protein
MRKLDLKKRLVICGAALILIPLLTLGVYLDHKLTGILTGNSERAAMQNLKELVGTIQLLLTKEVAQVNGLSALESIGKTTLKVHLEGVNGAKDEIKALNAELLSILKRLGSQYSGIFLADAKGVAFAGVLSNGDTKEYAGKDFSERDYFKGAKEGKPTISSVLLSKVTNKPVMAVGTPILSEKGEFLGALVLTSKVDFLIDLIARVKKGTSGYAFMVNEKGVLIAHPAQDQILKSNIAEVKDTEELAKKMIAKEEGSVRCSIQGVDNIVSFAPIGIMPWSIGLVQPMHELLADLIPFKTEITLFGVVLLVVALISVIFFSRSISKPINMAMKGLSNVSDQLASAAAVVSSSSRQLAEGASEQAAAIEETSSSLEEMSSMTKQNADNAEHASQLIYGTKETVARASRSMEQLTTSMGEISKASEETSKIIKTIDEIAFQTNLLALNAAVEAARAGEAGAGFAVVADEVRNLAMRAAEAAKNTANLIEGTVKKVKEGSELMVKTEQEFQEVAVSVGKSSELVGEISAASVGQSQGIEQANKAVSEMDKVVQQNAANTEESASASKEMNAQANQMKAFVGELKTLVNGSKGNGAVRSAESKGNKLVANRTAKNQPKIFAGHQNKGDGHAVTGNGKDLTQFKKGETRPEQLIPFNDSDF